MKSQILIFFAMLIIGSNCQFFYKDLAGPPEEFDNLQIVNSFDIPLLESSIIESLIIDQTGLNFTFFVDIFNFTFSLVSNNINLLKFEVYDSTNKLVPFTTNTSEYFFGIGNTIPALFVALDESTIGNYTLYILPKIQTNVSIIWNNNDNLKIMSYFESPIIHIGKTITIFAEIVNKDKSFCSYEIISSTMKIRTPSNKNYVVNMKPSNKRSQNVLLSIDIFLDEVGHYLFSPKIIGKRGNYFFQREITHLIPVSPSIIDLYNTALIEENSFGGYNIVLYISDDSLPLKEYRVYTELWGTDRCHKLVPVSWLGGINEVIDNTITLELDANWLKRVNICSGLYLYRTYLSDPNTSYPVYNSTKRIELYFENGNQNICEKIKNMKHQSIITTEMREGIDPFIKYGLKRGTNQVKRGIIMLPGYCSSTNPWLESSSSFIDAYYFDEYNLNLSNDEYAKRVILFANRVNLTSFGIIAHSQGGMVALTIKNYYRTGLDLSIGIAQIQTLGTPWQGTHLAEKSADFFEEFEISCGANSDLTTSGAANWLSMITDSAISFVRYYTTVASFSTFDWCNLITEIGSDYPNDGITELSKSRLLNYDGISPGNMGTKENQCHTTGMKYPAQYLDQDRNVIMNRNAAR